MPEILFSFFAQGELLSSLEFDLMTPSLIQNQLLSDQVIRDARIEPISVSLIKWPFEMHLQFGISM